MNGKPVTPPTRERVFYLARLMLAGEYDGATATELADEWGLVEGTVVKLASEASRLLEYTTNDREHLVRLARLRLRQVGEDDGPDRVQAWRTLLEHLGELRKRVEVSGVPGSPVHIAGGVTATIKQEPIEHLRALLRDPPPEVEALLVEEWGPRTVIA